jgi:hypothetical protein
MPDEKSFTTQEKEWFEKNNQTPQPEITPSVPKQKEKMGTNNTDEEGWFEKDKEEAA